MPSKWGKRLEWTARTSGGFQLIYPEWLHGQRLCSALFVRVRGSATVCPRCTGHQPAGNLTWEIKLPARVVVLSRYSERLHVSFFTYVIDK